jgi:hypothetical protein
VSTHRQHLKDYIANLSWVLQRKDMDSFWPIGFATTCTKYGSSIAQDLEQSFDRVLPFGKQSYPDFPTSFTVIALGIVYGTFNLDWPSERKRQLFDNVLIAAANNKDGDLLNKSGSNRIISIEDAFSLLQHCPVRFFSDTPQSISICNRLSSVLLAYAEAVCFCNHRVITEKHGPYLNETTGKMILIRSAKNLQSVLALWPELERFTNLVELLPQSIDMCFVSAPFEVHFDMFSNIIHSADVNKCTTEVGIAVVGNNYTKHAVLEEYEQIIDLITTFEQIIIQIVTLVGQKSKKELEKKLAEILYYSCRFLFEAAGFDWHKLYERALYAHDDNGNLSQTPSSQEILHYLSSLTTD